MFKSSYLLLASIFILSAVFSTFAATPVNLRHQSFQFLQGIQSSQSTFKQTHSASDLNQTQHVRMQQYFVGFPVWGADIAMHIPKGVNRFSGATKMNGIVYQGLDKDLAKTPSYIFTPPQKEKALQFASQLYQKKMGYSTQLTPEKKQLMVYVDSKNKAHWVFLIGFSAHNPGALPAKPIFILDAVTFEVYQAWDDIKTLDEVVGGGFGGNEKQGKYSYGGSKKDFPALDTERNPVSKICYLQNDHVIVKDVRHHDDVMQFKCTSKDRTQGNIYWNGQFDAVNGGYSPSNDALFVGKIVVAMYSDWYNMPVLTRDGEAMTLIMRVHENIENAYWNGQEMTFGDGISLFYPLVSLGVGAHEISHGFTEQHSNLAYYGQSGALNEAFSDMAAQAAEFYVAKKNSWEIGAEILKAKNKALRYMDEPIKDCGAKKPGNRCSISQVKDYSDDLDVHYSSGIFNKIFYLIGTAKGWDTHKAFDVMVQANQYYWTSLSTFQDAACGILKAADDYQYKRDAIEMALNKVGIDIGKC